MFVYGNERVLLIFSALLLLIPAFLTGEKLELRAEDVDINPNYTESIEIETFAMHLAFEDTFSSVDEADASKGKGRQQVHALDLDKQRCLAPYNNPGIAGFEAGLDEVGALNLIAKLLSFKHLLCTTIV